MLKLLYYDFLFTILFICPLFIVKGHVFYLLFFSMFSFVGSSGDRETWYHYFWGNVLHKCFIVIFWQMHQDRRYTGWDGEAF